MWIEHLLSIQINDEHCLCCNCGVAFLSRVRFSFFPAIQLCVNMLINVASIRNTQKSGSFEYECLRMNMRPFFQCKLVDGINSTFIIVKFKWTSNLWHFWGIRRKYYFGIFDSLQLVWSHLQKYFRKKESLIHSQAFM